MHKNKLIYEKSPYLLQHSNNPVNWNAWNEESLKLAKDLDIPIFLSVGYSTCYWCHVMERECFEDEIIANLLNDNFVNIKVDREERPDIDRIYMTALQSMTGSGGWPMNIFLTPDLKPFYGATYIPPKAKYGRSGFEDILIQINNLWKTKKQELITSSEKIFDILNSKLKEKNESDIKINDEIIDKSFDTIKNIFDYENGGFGIGNKFPRPVVIDFLLSYYYQSKNTVALDMAIFTLKKMCEGGLYDHLGGGFHRYAVDIFWRVPHFEKMLYDQAQIASALFDIYSITNKKYFLDYAVSTLNYVMENLTDKNGGFYSAEDAESAIDDSTPGYKEEGYYYLWEKSNIEDILGKENSAIFCYAYGIKYEGNTISDPHNVFKNKNVLFLDNDIYDTSKEFKKSPEEIENVLKESRNLLFNIRTKRPRPHRDDKILTSWNSLMISAFAKGYNITGEEKFKDASIKCVSFILKNLWNEKKNTLYHRFRENEVKFTATLDDYAFLIKAFLDLYETTFDEQYIKYASQFFENTFKVFYDKENSGFFDTEPSLPDVILKTKDIYDGAEPSGNSVMIENSIRLGNFTGNKYFSEIAEKSIECFFNDIDNLPFSSPLMLKNILFIKNAPKEIILTGNTKNSDLQEIIKYINGKFLPFKTYIYANKNIEEYSSYIRNIINDYKSNKVYLCENQSCKLPVDNLEDLKKIF